jgi:hypothetical protein
MINWANDRKCSKLNTDLLLAIDVSRNYMTVSNLNTRRLGHRVLYLVQTVVAMRDID